jgi:hypothetical protein
MKMRFRSVEEGHCPAPEGHGYHSGGQEAGV